MKNVRRNAALVVLNLVLLIAACGCSEEKKLDEAQAGRPPEVSSQLQNLNPTSGQSAAPTGTGGTTAGAVPSGPPK